MTQGTWAPRRPVWSVAAIVLALWLLAGCGGKDADTASTTSSTVDLTSTTVPIGVPDGAELVGLKSLEDGMCFDLRSDSRSLSRAAWKLDCSQPHDYEIYASFEYEGQKSGRGATYPGAPVVQDQAERRCYDDFEPFVGVRWTISELDIRTWWPSQESWDNHDRTLLCAVTATDRSPLQGTERGSGR